MTGSGFQGTPTLRLGSAALNTVTRINDQQLTAVIPVGLPLGIYDLSVTNPDGAVVILAQAFTVTGSEIAISDVLPSRGLAGFEVSLNIYGSNFADDATVQVAGETLPVTMRVGNSYLRVTAPGTLAAGAHDVMVVNPGGGAAIAVGAYTVLDHEATDDLYADGTQFSTEPNTLRSAAPGVVRLTVVRQGGKNPLPQVDVRFLVGAPSVEAGGTLLGVGLITPHSPRTSATTTSVNWTPTAPGSYTLYAIIDPENRVAESVEGNNVVSRTLSVLPQAVDQVAPRVDSFTINGGEVSVIERRVRLDALASDPTPSSGLQSLLYQEFEFSQAANQWVPVRTSGWQEYKVARSGYSWDLVDSSGIKYLYAWVADSSGNISAFPYLTPINYVPPRERVGRNMARSYRYYLEAGQGMEVRVEPFRGDPDLYVWPSNPNEPPYVSNLPGEVVDRINFTAAASGEYQVEVYGYSEAEYRLVVVVGDAASVAASSGNTPDMAAASSGKDVRTESALPRDSVPAAQQSLPPAPALDTPVFRLYLPAVAR